MSCTYDLESELSFGKDNGFNQIRIIIYRLSRTINRLFRAECRDKDGKSKER